MRVRVPSPTADLPNPLKSPTAFIGKGFFLCSLCLLVMETTLAYAGPFPCGSAAQSQGRFLHAFIGPIPAAQLGRQSYLPGFLAALACCDALKTFGLQPIWRRKNR